MRQLVKILRSGFILMVLCLVTIIVLAKLTSKYGIDRDSYVAASIDKEHQLGIVKSHRIIFVGGSNLALGLNSTLMSRMTGYSIINMGLHAGLGLSFALNEAEQGIKSGDIVILSIEHFLGEGNNKLIAQLISNNPKAYSLLDLNYFDIIRIKTAQLQLCVSGAFYRLIGRTRDPYYYRSAFTRSGDLISHYGAYKPSLLSGVVSFPEQDYSIQLLKINRTVNCLIKKGAKVYFVYPAFSQSAYVRNKGVLANLEHQYRSQLKCPILNTISSSIYEDKYFFDTVYHLDSLGIQIRTNQLYNLLKKNKCFK